MAHTHTPTHTNKGIPHHTAKLRQLLTDNQRCCEWLSSGMFGIFDGISDISSSETLAKNKNTRRFAAWFRRSKSERAPRKVNDLCRNFN